MDHSANPQGFATAPHHRMQAKGTLPAAVRVTLQER
jgi:hypothetical protein